MKYFDALRALYRGHSKSPSAACNSIGALTDAIKGNALEISQWVALIDYLYKNDLLTPHSRALVTAHKIHPNAGVVRTFSNEISIRGAAVLKRCSSSPQANVDTVIQEIVKWKTVLQCAHTHNVSKGYFVDAEPYIDVQWNQIIWPLIHNLDFTCILDLACGHGRNSEYLRRLTRNMHLVDINKSCLDACIARFGNCKDGTTFTYHLTTGNNLATVSNASISLVYSWDSMVHFDKLVVWDYLVEIKRVLRSGGTAFLHHSNLGEKSPNSDWATNPGTRSDMSADLMRIYASQLELDIVSQHKQGRAQGWGEDDLDCVSICHKP
jgi:SAM-dependent methyltransferase